jgi:hypothetical protein
MRSQKKKNRKNNQDETQTKRKGYHKMNSNQIKIKIKIINDKGKISEVKNVNMITVGPNRGLVEPC